MKRRNEEEMEFETIIVVPPDGGWGWIVVFAAFYCIFVMDGIANTYGLLLPVFQKEFDATLSEVSLINSLFTGFYFLFGPLASALSNRFGFRATIISGSIVSAFGIGISAFNTSVQLMFLTYGFVGGLGFSLMYINVLLTVGFYFERWRALATGITLSASGAGTFSFAPAVQVLLETYTWKHVLVGYAALVFLCSAAAVCFRPLTPVHLEIEGEPRKTSDIKKTTIRSSPHYPTAAEATNFSNSGGSKISLRTNLLSSVESVEVRGQSGGESSTRFGRRSLFGRPGFLDGFPSIPEIEGIRSSRCKKIRMRCKQCCGCRSRRGLRPLYRDDIFYDSSVTHLYERTGPSRGSVLTTTTTVGHLSRVSNRSLYYNMSVSRLPTRGDLFEEEGRKFLLCPERVTRVLRTMFDFSIAKMPTYLFFLTSTAVVALGTLIPVHFSYVRAVEMKIMNKDEASLLLSTIGITNTVGRILCGLAGSIRRVNIVLLHLVFLIFGACLNAGVIFFFKKTVLYIYGTLYGFVLAEQGSLRSVILVQLVGLENLTNAFGILLLFLGVSTIAGMPIAGYLKDVFDSYDSVFYFSSAIFMLSAILCAPILFWKRCADYMKREHSKQNRRRVETEADEPRV